MMVVDQAGEVQVGLVEEDQEMEGRETGGQVAQEEAVRNHLREMIEEIRSGFSQLQ